MNSAPDTKDPVCQMDVAAETDAPHSEYEGRGYSFCGDACKAKFDLHPDRYTASPGTTRTPR